MVKLKGISLAGHTDRDDNKDYKIKGSSMLILKLQSAHIGYQDRNLPKIKMDLIFYHRCAVYQWISSTSVEQLTGQMKILYLFTQLQPSNDKQE